MCIKSPDIRIISGLNLSTGLIFLFSNICKNSLLLVPALRVALYIFPTPVSSSDPVPGNKGNSWVEP